jgi:hypothetical protein
MNERIKELWEQGTFTVVPRDGDYSSVSADNINKFVELVILEAANVLNSWKHEPFPYDPEFGANLIKQHFGVK